MWKWASSAPGRSGGGACDDEQAARRAAESWMRDNHGTGARPRPLTWTSWSRCTCRSAPLSRQPRTTATRSHGSRQSRDRNHPEIRPDRRPVRGRIADGSLRAGMYAPSGAELPKKARVGHHDVEHLQSPLARQRRVHEGDRGLGYQSALRGSCGLLAECWGRAVTRPQVSRVELPSSRSTSRNSGGGWLTCGYEA
jgi:hypothetical protein